MARATSRPRPARPTAARRARAASGARPARTRPPTALVLAAGRGKRMRSATIKLLHPVAGRAMVEWVVEAVGALRPARLLVVVGHQGDRVRAALEGSPAEFVIQKEQRGTGHAVLAAAARIPRTPGAPLLILSGDLPTLRPSTLRRLVERHRRARAALTLVTAEIDDPRGYGRIVRDGRDGVRRIVEHRDATPEEREIHEVNCGTYCADAAKLLRVLRRVRPDNVQGEYYLTDAVQQLIAAGETVVALPHDDAEEVLGVNDRAQLASASRSLYERKAAELLRSGVSVLDPARTWIDPRARVGRDSVIYPDVIVEGPTVIGRSCTIFPGCRLAGCVVGDGVEVRDHSVLVDSRVGSRARVGPFAHLRPGSVLGPDTRVGNFVELKQTWLGPGSKASHLSYLGDARIGPDCNIGAGTITCNYDGSRKHTTTLGRGVFVGSDTQLVAPVTVRDGAYIAAGTTVTQDVPAGALAIGRGRQRNVDGWVARRKAAPARAPGPAPAAGKRRH